MIDHPPLPPGVEDILIACHGIQDELYSDGHVGPVKCFDTAMYMFSYRKWFFWTKHDGGWRLDHIKRRSLGDEMGCFVNCAPKSKSEAARIVREVSARCRCAWLDEAARYQGMGNHFEQQFNAERTAKAWKKWGEDGPSKS